MKFCDYPDNWTACKKAGLDKTFGIENRDQMYGWFADSQSNPLGLRQGVFDKCWHEAKCPYYDVYPSIIPMLTKLKLDIPGSCVAETANYLPHLLIRLPDKEHELTYEDPKKGATPVRTIFISFQVVNRVAGTNDPVVGMVVGIDINERDELGVLPVHTMKVFPLDDRNIEDVIDSLPPHFTTHEGMQIPNDLINKCIKLCLTLRLLEDSPDLIEPDVLSKDRARYEDGDEELRQRLLDKARRRGKWGFSVGRAAERGEMSPHYRRTHLCLVWTGPGRKIPKITKRKGSLVRRDKVEKIPTGYGDEDGSNN